MATRGSGRRRKTAARPSRAPTPAVRELLRSIKKEAEGLAEEMPFEAYLQRVQQSPELTRLSHELIYEAIVAGGVATGPEGEPSYALFESELFGIEDVVRQVVEYFSAAGRRLDVRRRILLLAGPPGCGKSTLVNAIKRGLEAYTRTARGAVYTIKGCPVQEDPLHLIPAHHRGELKGLRIEGDLCPFCRWLVREVYGGDVAKVPVQRVVYGTSEGVGIGTFVATDPGSEDIRRLVGTVDETLLPEQPDEMDAHRAFRLDGELCRANRGIADLIEVFKMDERFLSALLTVSQEQLIKFSGPMTMYADEAIVGHTNLAEYGDLADNPRAAALQDRLVVVRVRYVLAVHHEIAIYDRMLGDTDLRGSHISPLVLPGAATLAVLTRLAKPSRMSWNLRKKLQLYDGRYVGDADQGDLRDLRAAAPEEGLRGISPRFVINQLSYAMGRQSSCLSGMGFLETLWENLSQRADYREQDKETWSELFEAARAEHDEMVERAVRRSMVQGFDEKAATKARAVLRELRRWARGQEDEEAPVTAELERRLGVPHYRRDELRRSLLGYLDVAAQESEDDLHLVDPRLEEALERDLLPAWGDAARVVRSGDRAELRKMKTRMIESDGFCEVCSEEILRYAGVMAGPRRERRAEEPGWSGR